MPVVDGIMLNVIGVFVAFGIIVFLIRRKCNFGLSMIIGSIIVGLFSLQTIQLIDIPKAMIQASFYSFTEQRVFSDTIELALLMALIYMLAKLMQETGAIATLIDSLRTFFSKGGTLGVIPAVYGLMPVPGGALFSAPMIEEEGTKFKLKKNQKNFLNVWFRHIWFPVYPLSSAMILLCFELANIDIYTLMLVDIPAFIGSILIGELFLRHFLRKHPKNTGSMQRKYNGLIYLVPPMLPLAFYSILQFAGFPQIRSFLLGVIFSIILLLFIIKIPWKRYSQLMKKAITWRLPLAIFGIMIFREMFAVSGANVVLADIIGSLFFPSLILVILIPLFLGVLTGYNLGAIALSYPLVEPFFSSTGLSLVGFSSIVFISSLIGYLVSPIHLCNVLSSEYLKTDTTRMYKMYIPAAICLLVIQVIAVLIVLRA
jgi:integral membrane protein (TIGR00529 family)